MLTLDDPGGGCDVIVIDNGPTPETAELVQARERTGAPVRYVTYPEGGAAAARNQGAELATGDLLIFCDDDILVEPDHLCRHIAAQEALPGALVNGVSERLPTVARTERPFARFQAELERRFEAELDEQPLGERRFVTPFLSARNLSVPRSVFESLGGFDEAFPYAGAEDQDFSLRARAAGCTLVRDHAIRVLHNEQWVTLEQFCAREERGAVTVVVLARKFPGVGSQGQIAIENAPVRRGDRPALVTKKLVKGVLSRRLPLAGLHRLVRALETLRVGDAVLRRVYRAVISLHIFRGVRAVRGS